ncbi:SMP-30/gluconolactonase/LRE family protein [Natronosporangium hydrolyticum]|uniref:SMP-30/gluconolactonase/LRE family protein n=1 Tax=Natronosporangium hydrolyticum TaxID=2811111 RepID=A0A895YSB7_9ACTN|nr:SMP-30/gluconolactonase/LRE family protein [Natronosporangium hydrolyticum]QSB16908.1 SMP-30/gluconolactonase/LRE family protein [Natronosporangium hydrolyticum]
MDVFDDRPCQLAEGPFYDPATGRVGWVDILGCRVRWRDLATGETGEVTTSGHVGAAVLRRGGGMVLCLPAGPVLLDDAGQQRHLGTFAEADQVAGAPPAADAPARRSNDAKADPAGRLWLGTMAYDETPGAGALYRLDPGASAPVRVLGEVTISNGLGWSPDHRLMYYVDTPTGRIDVFDFDLASGAITNRRPFVTVAGEGSPDGLCVDAAGGVWVALFNGGAVRRYTPEGALDRVVEVGTPMVTSCAFAGPDHRQLIITTARLDRDDPRAGLIYVHEPGDVTGLPVERFAG